MKIFKKSLRAFVLEVFLLSLALFPISLFIILNSLQSLFGVGLRTGAFFLCFALSLLVGLAGLVLFVACIRDKLKISKKPPVVLLSVSSFLLSLFLVGIFLISQGEGDFCGGAFGECGQWH